MGRITEQYIGAIQQWNDRMGKPYETLIPEYMYLMASGRWPGTLENQTHESVRDFFSLENTRRFLEINLEHTDFKEAFLITAFIHAIEDRFRVDLALCDQKQDELEKYLQSFRERATSPEERSALDNLETMIGRSDPSENTLEKIQIEQALTVWREVTAPILEPTNLDACSF